VRLFVLVLGLLLTILVSCVAASAQEIPANARRNLPALVDAQRTLWPDAPTPWFLAGQVEQESCVSLHSPKCWDTHAELKTHREYGFGLGQITIAYRTDGSVRFNKWAELRTKYPPLREWSWDQRFDASYQLAALTLMDRGLCRLYSDALTPEDLLGFCLSAYNGGEGGVAQDRLLCSNTSGCNPRRWYGNVELHSLKQRVPFRGYGKSPFDINRGYPRAIRTRQVKYQQFFR
jgi:hypothetical protein